MTKAEFISYWERYIPARYQRQFVRDVWTLVHTATKEIDEDCFGRYEPMPETALERRLWDWLRKVGTL